MRSLCPEPMIAALALTLALPSLAHASEQDTDTERAIEETAAAQPDELRWTVQVDPLTTALGFVHVQLERTLSARMSLYVGPHLRLFNGLISEPDDDYRGVGAEVGVRYFLTGVAPEGLWLGVRAVAAHISSPRVEEAEIGGYASALGGYTWIFAQRWVLAAGLGVQYIRYQVGGQGPRGILPAAHTALGVAF